jgi:hypothetical protein
LCPPIRGGGHDGGDQSNVQRALKCNEPHPHLYRIQWLNDSSKAKVTQNVRVHFSISTYSDFADCDVVPMQACSLLLGRLWEYDIDALHHGRSNKYTFYA